jgi:hypothetical protein
LFLAKKCGTGWTDEWVDARAFISITHSNNKITKSLPASSTKMTAENLSFSLGIFFSV